MGSDTPMVVHLEVTVPPIMLSALRGCPVRKESGKAEQDIGSWQSVEEDMEQVRLVLAGQHQEVSHQQQHREPQQGITGIASSRMIHTMRFRMFRVGLPARQNQAFLLQIFRRYDWPNRLSRLTGAKRRKRNTANAGGANGQLCLTDELAFSLERCRTEQESAEALSPASSPSLIPIPGLNRVVIFLDNEGTPCGYSIDGAES
jgi:hypothetical protein